MLNHAIMPSTSFSPVSSFTSFRLPSSMSSRIQQYTQNLPLQTRLPSYFFLLFLICLLPCPIQNLLYLFFSDSGYVCMVFYKRDSNVIEIQQTEDYVENPDDACAHFDPSVVPFMTLISKSQIPYLEARY